MSVMTLALVVATNAQIQGLTFANPTVPLNQTYFDSLQKANIDLTTLVVVVVGGSSGIGKAAVDEYRNLGCIVIVTSRDWSNHPDYREDVDKRTLDVTRPRQRRRFTNYMRNNYGVIHVLHLNSARVNIGTPLGTGMQKRKLLWETNYFGPIALYRDVECLFSDSGYAHVMITCSIANDQFLIPNADGSYQVVEFFDYYASKPAILRFWMALWAQYENTKINGTDWPAVNANIKVSIVNPAQYSTRLGYNAIVADSDFAESRYPFDFGVLGLPLENIGKAFGQLIRLENPPLINYVVDQSVSVTDPNPYPAIYQDTFYRSMGFITDISVDVDDSAWPPV